jgi:3-oxoacyl-[acyl-carrier protein] reductase
MKLLDGKIALVTGASKGIGRAIALKYAEQGAKVAFTYLSSVAKGEELQKELIELGVEAKGYRSDASDFSAAQDLIAEILKDFGGIDIIVNNAGITKDGLLMRMTEDAWDQVMEVNLKSCFNVVKAAIRPMMKQRSGSIINVSSIVGIKGNAGQSNYAASKAGIIGFSKSVAIELGSRGIRSNVIAPGFIASDMTDSLDEKVIEEWKKNIPLNRIGTGVDIANSAVFLGSDMSSYVSGQTIQVNGGMLTAN